MKTINDYAELVKEKHALNKTIAPVETDLTDASRDYHIGEQFINDGEIYKAKTEIAQHDALVLNTNYEPADDLTTQIKNAGGGTGTDPRLDVFENNIAPVETDETDASKAYQVGEQLILSNILYDVIAPISEHDVITTTGSGANIEPADPISSQFQTLTNQVKDMNNILGAKNLLPPNNISQTIRGVTFTPQADGSVIANGTQDGGGGGSYYHITDTFEGDGDYIINGCPSGGSASTYRLYIWDNTSHSEVASDIGNGASATLVSGHLYTINIMIGTSQTVSNLTFYPMIRLASITDDTYEPYAKTNQQLTEDSVDWDDYSELGAVNFIYPNDITKVEHGITYTLNSDNSLTLSGTPDGSASAFTYRDHEASLLAGKTVKFKANPSSQYVDSKLYVAIICRATETGSNLYRQDLQLGGSNYQDELVFTVPSGTNVILANVCMYQGATDAINITCKPMLTVASYNGDYVPYAKSNRELTEDVAELNNYQSTTSTPTVTSTNITLNARNCKRMGRLVQTVLDFSATANANAYENVFTLEDEFIPLAQITQNVPPRNIVPSTYGGARVNITTLGVVQVSNIEAGGQYNIILTYISKT